MPDRIVRAGILSSDPVNRLSWAAEVFYRRLHSVVDDYGRYDGRPTMLRAHLYPLKIDRVSDADVGKWLAECATAGLVSVYQVSGFPYLEVLKFGQRVRSASSKWPAPPANGEHSRTNVSGCQQMTALCVDVDVDVDVDGDASAAGPPPCPHDEILNLYHEILPANPRVKVWGDDRKANLRTRWREESKRQSLDYWRRLFEYVGESEFLTGRATGHDGRPFFATLAWLVLPKNFAKVIEGNYHDRK